MATSITYDLLKLVIDNREALGLPEVINLDYLPEKGSAISLETESSPKFSKSYINGFAEYQLACSFLAVADGRKSATRSLEMMGWLDALGALFSEMKNYSVSESRTIIKCDTTTPALITRQQDGRIVYSLSIQIYYKEKTNG